MDASGITKTRITGSIMNVLGLDMSSQKSGYSLFKDGQLVDYGLWENHDKDWRGRIAYMSGCVQNYCNEHKVDKIYVEDVPPTIENSQTVKVLSALQGMLISIAVRFNIPIEFIPVKTWKSKIGINLVSSKENIEYKKRVKENHPKELTKFKGWVKAWEKKLSVDYVNHTFGLDLVYKSPSSKFNQDDIADSMNVAWSQIGDVHKYDLETFDDIMYHLYSCL